VSGEAESNLKFMLSGSSYGKGRSYGDHCIESFPLYRPHLLRIREELKALDPLAAAFYSASATEADFARFKTQFSRFATEVAGLEAALRQRPAQVNLLDECSAPTPAHGKLALSIFWAPMAERLASLVDVLGRNIAEVEKASR